jgi:hypothetical protein
VAFSALDWENLTLLVDLVGRRKHALLEEDLLHADLKLVALRSIGSEGLIRVAIKEGLGSNIAKGMVELAFLGKDSIEGLNMGVNGRGEGRVC